MQPGFSNIAGGICGSNEGTVSNCYNTGSIFASERNNLGWTTNYAYSGGICGYNTGSIENCYNTGPVAALVADMSSWNNNVRVGGICGFTGDNAKVRNSYWNADSNQTVNEVVLTDIEKNGIGYGIGQANALTSEQMRQQSSFIGWDFNDIWILRSTANNGYPVLRTFFELPSSWADANVNRAIALGLVQQSMQSKYTQATTRAEFYALVVALHETVSDEYITGHQYFYDINDANVQKAAAIGVVQGVGDNRFNPNDPLTREQAATMLTRLANALEKPLSNQAATFTDNNSVSSWAIEAVGQMQISGIMGGVGDNRFAPKDPYTREQSITTVMRLYDLVT